MYRKLEKHLVAWKHDKHHKPLIIRGSRQVGKTYTITKFAKENYTDVIIINFERDLDIQKQFQKSIRPNDIINYLKLIYREHHFDTDSTLIFMDEIQACPNALTALKFFAQETSYDIIASGSLLGVAIANSSSFPVGYVTTIDLYPMDFEEFLLAMKITAQQLDELKEVTRLSHPLNEGIHKVYLDLFRQYIVCGGMPAVVQAYAENKDFLAIRVIQKQIIRDYHDDMAKYALANEKIKVRECFEAIPNQLAKENKKFQYKLVSKGGSARHYEGSLQWLKESGSILPCTRVSNISYPLSAQMELNIFKVYMFDTGLLVSCYDSALTAAILNDDAFILKGAIYENITAQMLQTIHYPLYYFEPNSRSEIDFLIEDKMDIIPIEIKASKNAVSRSLNAYHDKYKPPYALKFSSNNINTQGTNKCYPLYMLAFLFEKG